MKRLTLIAAALVLTACGGSEEAPAVEDTVAEPAAAAVDLTDTTVDSLVVDTMPAPAPETAPEG